MESYEYSIESHVSQFADMLKENIQGLEVQDVTKKLTFTFFFNSTVDVLIADSVEDSNDFYQGMLDTAVPLQIMMETTNNFDETFTLNKFNIYPYAHFSQYVNRWNGVCNKSSPQLVLIIVQLIQTNFRKNRKNEV